VHCCDGHDGLVALSADNNSPASGETVNFTGTYGTVTDGWADGDLQLSVGSAGRKRQRGWYMEQLEQIIDNELRGFDQVSSQIEACDRGRAEYGDLAENVFERSLSLTEKWLMQIAAPNVSCLKSSV
jgi:hypothetical protein